MGILNIFKIVAAAATILTGLVSLLRPEAAQRFTRLRAPDGRGISEVRSVLGGLFIGLGVAPLILASPAAYQTLGIAYLATGIVRTASMFLDEAVESSNLISVAVELVFGLLLVL